jgi:hypothetical protein
MKLSDFITTNGITLHSNECAYNRYLQGYWPPHSLHWACRLYCGATKKRMNVTITHGPLVKHAPILLDVLDSLAVETGLLAERGAASRHRHHRHLSRLLGTERERLDHDHDAGPHQLLVSRTRGIELPW